MVIRRPKIKIFTSNQADSMTKKVNDFLAGISLIQVISVSNDISYTEKRGYMMSCMIYYFEEEVVEGELDTLDYNIDFGLGEPLSDVPTH